MKKIHKLLLTVFVLLPMQISFNNFGLSILHNDIDDMSSPNDANIDSLKYEKVKENKDEPNTNPFIDKLNTASSEPSVLNENNNDDKFGENIGTVVIEPRSDTTESPLVENQIKDDNQKKDLNENLVPNEESIVKDEDKKSVSLLDDIKEAAEISSTKSDEEIKQSNTSETTTNPSETTTESPSKSAETVIVSPKKTVKPDIESFEEWKDTKLKEKAKIHLTKTERKVNVIVNKEVEKPEGDGGKSISSDQEDDDQSILQQRKNYASPDCGAKLIGNNPESNHPSHILSENKDDYMLNACKNKVWFSIELCEPIKISTFELANLELFSNVPKRFRVYASERFIQTSNGKEWPSKYLIGTFEASNVRSIQKFSLSKDALPHSSSNDSQISNNFDKSANPLHSVYVKYIRFEMISHYGSQHYCPLTLLRIYGKSVSDVHDEEIRNEEEDIQPTVTKETEKVIDTYPVTETTSTETNKVMTSSNDVSPSFLNNLISIITHNLSNLDYIFNKFMHTESPKVHESLETIQNDFYKILCNCHRFDRNEFLDCCQCLPEPRTAMQNYQNERSFNWLNNKCGYYFLMNTNNNALLSNYLINMKLLPLSDNKQSYFEVPINRISYFIKDNWLQKQINLLRTLPYITSNTVEPNEVSNKEDVNTELEFNEKNEANVTSNQTDNNKPADKESPNKSNEEKEVSGSSKSDSEIRQEIDVITDEAESIENNKDDQQDSSVLSGLTSLNPNNQESESTTQIVEPTTTQSPPTQVTNPPPTINKEPILTYGKESGNVLMRLTNRIKNLELNMSLSSQYLEKLSQHYRLQMDEMESRFNFTTTALKEATRVSDTRDLKQHERIITLEKRLEILQKSLVSSLKTIDDLKFQSDLLAVSIVTILSITILAEILRKLFQQTKSTTKHQKNNNKPKEVDSESSEANLLSNLLTQKQIEFLVERKINRILREQGLVKKVRTKSFHAGTSDTTKIETMVPKLVDDFQQQFMSIA